MLVAQLEVGEQAEVDAARTCQARQLEVEARASVLTTRRRDLDVRAAGLAEREQLLQRRLDDAEGRLAQDATRRAAATDRRTELDRSLVALGNLARLVDAHRNVLDAHHGELAERRRQQSDHVRELAGRLDAMRGERAARRAIARRGA